LSPAEIPARWAAKNMISKTDLIVVLMGGPGSEKEVSIASGQAVLKSLLAAGYRAEALEVTDYEPEIPKGTKLAFNLIHGTFGEDGTVQGLLEVADIPYVGAGVLGSSLGMDKAMVKRVWLEAGLSTIPFVEVHDRELESSTIQSALIDRILGRFDFPLFVKPSRSGSSVGVTRTTNRTELQVALHSAFKFDTKALVEPEVKGREVECSVVGNHYPDAYAVGEIVPTHEHKFYDYDAKYLDPEGALLKVPAQLPSETTAAVQELAVAAYVSAEAEGFARLDFFVTEENGVVLNEINTIPGFTSISMFPKLCEHTGLSYPVLITTLIELGIERYQQRTALHYTRE
jgi:D-alanine-D-alanine ligase